MFFSSTVFLTFEITFKYLIMITITIKKLVDFILVFNRKKDLPPLSHQEINEAKVAKKDWKANPSSFSRYQF